MNGGNATMQLGVVQIATRRQAPPRHRQSIRASTCSRWPTGHSAARSIAARTAPNRSSNSARQVGPAWANTSSALLWIADRTCAATSAGSRDGDHPSQDASAMQAPGPAFPPRRCAGSRPGVGRRGKGGSSPCSPCSAACVLRAAARGSGPDQADRLSRRPPIARPGRTAPEEEARRHGASGTSGCERSDHGSDEHPEARTAIH